MFMVLVILTAVLALLCISLLKAYRHVSTRELRRRAQEGDELAAALYKAVAYGHSLGAVLWFLLIMSNALFFVVVSRSSPIWFAVTASAALLWFGFVWLPARDVTRFSTWLAVRLAPIFAWILHYLHPLINRLVIFVDRHKPVTVHTGMYDRKDLLRLLEQQRVQPDNRVEKAELDIARHALTFGDALVGDIMVPRRVVKAVSSNDKVGPILMSELHDSGFSRFPVFSGKKDNIVGTLYLKDLVNAKAGGVIEHIMRDGVAYVHEDQPLTDALQAILKTRQHQFIVVNGFEEYVGIITMEDVLEQIIGKPILDEFDQYDDLRAVAAREARKEHKKHSAEEKTSEKPTEDNPEVVK